MGMPDHLICLLRNQYAGQEAAVRTGHGTTDWFQIRKGVRQRCILSPCFLTYMQSTSCEMPDWMMHKLESDCQEKYIYNLRHAVDTTLTADSEEELKSLLGKVKEENEKVGLKLKIQKTKIMVFGPITSWQRDGETVLDYFWGLQNHCRW